MKMFQTTLLRLH